MKKNYSVFAFLIFLVNLLFAQTIPNSGFETWNGISSSGWFRDTLAFSKSADAHGGAFAAKLTIPSYGYSAKLYTQSSTLYDYYLTVADPKIAPTKYVCWYKYYGSDNPQFSMMVSMKDSSGTIGQSGITYSTFGSSSSYQLLSVSLSGNPGFYVKSVCVWFTFGGQGYQSGDYVIIDDIAPANNSGVDEIYDENMIEKVFPNPTRDRAEIIYKINMSTHVTLAVNDISGKLVSMLTDEYESEGKYKATISNLAKGIYFCMLQTSEGTRIQKLVITE